MKHTRAWLFAAALVATFAAQAAPAPQIAAPAAPAGAAAYVPEAAPGDSIVLPPTLIAGEQATLAVLDEFGALVASAPVQVAGRELLTDSTGRVLFAAPDNPGVLTARLRGRDEQFSADVIAGGAQPASGAGAITPPLRFPAVIARDDRFEIDGTGFRGDAERDRVLIGGQPALVLAASPVSLVLLPNPRTPAGPAQLNIDAAGQTFVGSPMVVVSLDISGPSEALAAGRRTALLLRVTGTSAPLVVEVRNAAPGVIRLAEGDLQRVETSGGANNIATIEFTALKAGDYSLTARVIPGASLPDIAAGRKALLDARKVANGKWRRRIDVVLRGLETNPQDVARYRDEIASWSAERPPANLAQLFTQAQTALALH
jgi:hypothetical protein